MKGVRTRGELMAEGLSDKLQTVQDYVNWAVGIASEWMGADPTGETTLDDGAHQAVATLQDLVERALADLNYRVVSAAAGAIHRGAMRVGADDDCEVYCLEGYVIEKDHDPAMDSIGEAVGFLG